MTREAWFCPSCQKHHAPHVDTCPSISEGTVRRTVGPLAGIKPDPFPQPIWTAPSTGVYPYPPHRLTILVGDGGTLSTN